MRERDERVSLSDSCLKDRNPPENGSVLFVAPRGTVGGDAPRDVVVGVVGCGASSLGGGASIAGVEAPYILGERAAQTVGL